MRRSSRRRRPPAWNPVEPHRPVSPLRPATRLSRRPRRVGDPARPPHPRDASRSAARRPDHRKPYPGLRPGTRRPTAGTGQARERHTESHRSEPGRTASRRAPTRAIERPPPAVPAYPQGVHSRPQGGRRRNLGWPHHPPRSRSSAELVCQRRDETVSCQRFPHQSTGLHRLHPQRWTTLGTRPHRCGEVLGKSMWTDTVRHQGLHTLWTSVDFLLKVLGTTSR